MRPFGLNCLLKGTIADLTAAVLSPAQLLVKQNVSCQELMSLRCLLLKRELLVELNINILHSSHLFKVQEESHAESAWQLYFLLQLSPPAWFTRSSSLPGSRSPGWNNKREAEGYFSYLAPRHWRSAPNNLIPRRVSWLAYKEFWCNKKGNSWVPKDPPELQKNFLQLLGTPCSCHAAGPCSFWAVGCEFIGWFILVLLFPAWIAFIWVH